MAVCKAMRTTAISDASMPTERKKPLAWQNEELEGIGPFLKSAMGKMMNHSDLSMSLDMSSIMRLTMVSDVPG